MNTADLFAVGKVVKAFGIKGDVVIAPMTDSPHRFAALKHAYLGPSESTAQEVSITRAHIESRGVRLKVKGVNDRDAAEHIVGYLLYVDRRHRIKIPRGTYFIHDIIGLNVADEQGRVLGTVREVLRMPAHDVYVVGQDTREVLIPAVKEFILGVDLAERRMTVHLIEGMV